MLTEDLSTTVFSAAEFAESITVNAVAVNAIFNEGYSSGRVGHLGMASSDPFLVLPTASVPANPAGLPVVARGQSYRIAEHRPDGTGVSRLALERTA